MPDKKYLIEIPDMPEGSGIWEADKWERNKEAFMKENPTAKVFEMDAYNAEDTNENDQILISMDDEESSGLWEADKWERNKEAFLNENPTAQIRRVRYQDYWSDRAATIEDRLAELDQPDQERAARLAEIGYFDDNNSEANLDVNLKPVSQAMKINSVSGDVEYLDPAVEEFFANDDAYTQRELEKNQLRAEYETNPSVIAQKEWEAKMKEAEKAYRGELKQQITADYEANVDKKKAARGGIEFEGFPAYGPASFEAEKQDKYLASLQLLDFADRMEKGEKFWEGVGYGATKAAVDYDGKEMQQVGLVFKKLEDRGVNINEATEEQIDEALDPEDKSLMLAYLEYEKAMYEADPSRAFKGGAQFGETIPFILEFIATGDIYKAGAKKAMEVAGKKAIGKGFAKWIAKSAGKKLPTLMKQGVAKATSGTIKALGGTLTRTVAQPTTYVKMGAPDIQIDEHGDVSVETHAAREFFDHYIENLSEISGEGMVAGLGGAAKLLNSTKIGKMPFMKIGEWLGNKAVWQGLSKLGAQSLPIEVAEEVVGNALRYVTGVDKEALGKMFEKDEFASMLIGFAPLTVLGMGTSAAAMGAVNIGAAAAANKMRQALSPFYTEDQIDQVTGALERAKTSDEVVEALKPILVGMHDATQDEKTAVMDYAIKVAKKKAMISARNFQEMQMSDAAIRQVEEKVGKFWVENEDKTRTVRQADLNDGRQVFIVSQPNEANEVATVEVDTGKKGIAKLSDIKQEIFNSSLESYGTRFVMADRRAKEQERMANERQVQINLVRQNLSAQNGRINLGTEGAPIMVVADAETEAGIRYVAQNGSTGTLSWEQVADAQGTPIIVKTDAQLAQEEAAAIVARDAERRASQAKQDAVGTEEVTEAAEEVENAVSQLDDVHIPMNEDGTVNEAAFWEQNPEAYVQWNDEQQQDGGVDSLEQITNAKNELTGLFAEAQTAQQTSDPMQRKAAKAEVQRLSEKINTLTALEQKYVEALKTPEQKRKDVEEGIKTRAKEWSDKTGVEINVVENLSQVKNAEARAAMAKGQKVFAWTEGGKAYMYLPAIESVEQLDEKFAHEAVAHVGLRSFLGDGYDAMLDRVWNSMSDTAKRRYANYGTVRGNQRLAADEYLAHIAEKMGADVASVQEFSEEEKSVWQTIVDFVKETLGKVFGNLSNAISEEEISDLIRSSYQNLNKQTLATAESTEQQRSAINSLLETLTPEEAVEVAENDYQIASDALNELKASEPKVEKGESSASYIERKKAYNEGMREAQAKAEAARAIADEIKKMTATAQEPQVAELSDTQTTSSMIAPTTSSEGKDRNKIESATSSEAKHEPAIINNAEGKPIAETDGNGSTMLSVSSYEDGGRDYLVNWLSKNKDMDQEEKDFIIATLDQQYELAKQLGKEFPVFGAWSSAEVEVDGNGNPIMSVIKANGDYSMNLDFSLICKKRRPLNALLDIMIADRMLDMRSLDEGEIAKINKVIQQYGFEVACALCFVDSKRYRVVKVANDFADIYNDLVNSLIPAGSDIVATEYNYAGYDYINERNKAKTGTHLDEVRDSELDWTKVNEVLKGVKTPKTVEQKVAKMLKSNPQYRRLANATDFVTNLGFESVKKNNPALLKVYNAKKGTVGPKASFGDVQYLNDILKNKSFTPAKAYAVGGVRIQSFSDYMGHMFFDYMQMMAELAAKGLPAHAYTKEEAFARIFGMTGVKINLSLVPAVAKDGIAPGLDAEGSYVWAVPYTDENGNEIQGQTFPPEVAFEMQKDPRYSGNVGVIAVGISDEHILKMLDDVNIHFIIPYHKSSLSPIVAKETNIDKFKDYTNTQNTKLVSNEENDALSTKQKAAILKKNAFDFYGSLARTKDPKATAQEYLEHCKKHGFVPKFEQFSMHENYYKLLVDFNTYDFVTGEYAPQGPVKMNFPEELEDLVKASVASNEELEADLKDKVGRMAQSVKEVLGRTMFSVEPRTEEQRELLFDAAKKEYGVTDKINIAGYMLPDGSLLNFADKEGEPNIRGIDHRNIASVINDREYDSRWGYVTDFVNEGAIRMMPESDAVHLGAAPTVQQRQKLLDYFYSKNGYIILELTDKNGNNAGYMEYDEGTSPYRIMRDIDGYFQSGIAPQQNTMFSVENENQAIFVSNAANAVESIKMEKATPEQWLKMIEKNGGLKAGEDKWMGLSDWLKASDKKTLTKQEVLQFINDNMIVIEEQHYSDEEVTATSAKILTDKYPGWDEAFSFDWDNYMEEPYAGIWDNETAVELYNNNHEDQIELDEDGEFEDMEAEEKVTEFGRELAEIYYGSKVEVRSIHGTRSGYTTRGLQNNREIALTVPTIDPWKASDVTHFGDAGNGRAIAWIRFGETEYRPANIADEIAALDNAIFEYEGDLSDEKFKTLVEKKHALRRASRAQKVLVIDEIQSNRHQEGREKGYTDSGRLTEIRTRIKEIDAEIEALAKDVLDGNRSAKRKQNILYKERRDLDWEITKLKSRGVPAAPFEKNWQELAMKRMLRYAAENGFDIIAWTTGDQQAQRYDLSRDVLKISAYKPNAEGEKIVTIYYRDEYNDYKTLVVDREGKVVQGDYNGSALAEVVGKEMALQIMNTEDVAEFSGEGLKIGGEGMRGFYDKMLPAFMNKYGKKWGVKVEDLELPNLGKSGYTMHSVPVTKEMKTSVMEGQTMFSVVTPEVREEMDRIAANAIIDGNYMFAPNGQPTKLTADQWAMVRTENFTNWFGDWINDPENASKILDENGEPMVMYHGSAWEPLLEPKGEAVFRMNDGLLGKGAYFSNNLTEATAYAEIATDLDMTEEGNYELLQDKYVTDYFLNIRNEEDIYRQGGDIIAVAKSPNQIKSATDNNGEFSESSDIRFSVQEEGQPSEEFHNAVLDDFIAHYNLIVPTTVVRIEDRAALAKALGISDEDLTDDIYQMFKEEVENGGAAFYAEKTKRIVIFALDHQSRSAEIEDNIFHENTHALIDKHPELVELGQWLWDNAASGMRRIIKESILSKNYEDWQYGNEMLSKFAGSILALGRAGEVLNMLPADQKKHWEFILKEFGYEPEREDRRRSRRFSLDAARAGVSATKPQQTVYDNEASARYSAEERRVINELFPGAIREETSFSAEESAPEDYTMFSVVTDPALIEELENSPKIKVYRAMQLIDGELYPPMSAKVEGKLREPIKLGQWEQAEERPDLIDSKGNFKLDKANKASVPARYNPYFHTSRTPLNDQFSSAQSRPNLVTVEVEIPESELTSGYKADKAKDSVGEKDWKAGIVQGKLSGTRKVILSRWDKPVRIVPDSEVAAEIVKMFEGKDITMPSNVVTPSLRAELEKLGVPFVETDNNGKPVQQAESNTRFSIDSETEIKAIKGLSILDGMNISLEQEMVITREAIDAERKRIADLKKRLGDKDQPVLKKQIENAEDRLKTYLRQMEILQDVEDKLIKVEFVETDVRAQMANMEPQSAFEYLSELLTMHLTPVVQTKVVDADGKETIVRQGGKKKGIMLTPETLEKELGYSKSDWKGISYIVSESEGMSLDAIAEMIEQDFDASHIFGSMDTMEIKSVLIDFLQSMSSYTEIRDYIKNERERMAKEEADEINGRIQQRIEEIESQYGMSIDEYNAMLVQEERSARERWLEENEDPERFAKFEQSNIEDNGQTSGKAGEASEAAPGANGEGSEGGQASEGSGNVAGSGKNVENPADGGQEAGAGNNQGNGNGGGNNTGNQGGNTEAGVVPDNVELSRKSVEEIVESGKQKVLQQNAEAADTLMDRIRAINGNLQQLRMMAAAQREYDKQTVKTITDLANELLTNGALTDMTRGEIKRLLSVIKDATGKSDLTISVDRLMDIMIGNQLRYGKNRFDEYLKIRGKKVDARGVEVRGALDVEGQQVMDAVREGITLDPERIQDRISAAEDKLFDPSQTISRNAEHELAGLEIAKQYVENIKESESEEKDLRKELKDAKEQYDAGMMDKTAYREFVKATHDAIRENRMQRVMAYEALLDNMADMVKNSIFQAKQLREAENARVERIQHFANSDMQGMPADEHQAKTNEFWNNPIVRFLFKPLATFDQMLRHFAPKSRSGEGYLWNHFMGGWLKATENEYKGIQAAHDKLDAKVRSVFGDKVKRWSDLFAIERKMPKATISFWDAGEIKEFEVTQGNLLYIYMVNKMTDGKMKLRKMSISEEDVINMTRELDPRFLELADWLQEDFLPGLREKYNAVHERLFGAPMAAIDNYFPIRVLANARSREVDINIEESNAKPSTITGNIMKRTKNSLALDILGSDAFDVILGHINDMEKWAAFAEWNKDLNTLLSYKKFRNRVQNMSGIYGAGSVVWNNFRSVAEIAAGVYKPATKMDSVDKTIMNIAKGVTGAKISFRVYTAFKQLLSWPAFISDTNPVILAKNMANPFKAWNWSMENLPLFEKRWKSRQAGDSRLMATESDWKLWKTKVVEIAGRFGMTPNALVDAVTVAIGARSVYETRLKQYLDYGYDQEKAEEKAKRDATVVFNESQQSNESAFLSQIQMDRTVASVVLTVFRNSSMGYQRMYVDALRNITHMTKKGYKAESIEYMKKQMLRDGLTDAEAERAANRIYSRSFAKNAVQALTFGFIVQLAWNLGPYLPYIFAGDDDDQKKEMAKDAAVRAFVGGPVEGMSGGPVLSNILGNIAMGEKLSDVNGVQLPLSSDVENLFNMFGKDNVRAVNEIFNIVIQSGIGVNPQTITDAVVAIVDACNGDLGTATEAALCLMRMLQVPQSQLEELYLDEIDFSADDALDLTIKEFAERYAKYKVLRSAPLTSWMYDDEQAKEREESYIKRFTSKAEELKRTRSNEEAKAFYEYYDNEYEEVAESIRDLKRRAKEAEGMERKAISQEADSLANTEGYKRYNDLVGDIKAFEAYKKLLKDVTDPETRKEYEKEMLKHRRNVVNKINGYETETE